MNYYYAGQGAGSLFGAVGSFLGARAVQDASAQNAEYLNRSAEFDLRRGMWAELDVDRQARQILDAQKVAYAAQNVDLSSESVMQAAEEVYMETKRVKNMVELDAAMSAWGKREQARIGQEQARDQALGMRIGGVGQVIGGIGGLAAAGA